MTKDVGRMPEGINFSEIEDFVEAAAHVCAEEISSGMSRNTKVDAVRAILLIGTPPPPWSIGIIELAEKLE